MFDIFFISQCFHVLQSWYIFRNFGLQFLLTNTEWQLLKHTDVIVKSTLFFFKVLKYIHVQYISHTYGQSSEYDLCLSTCVVLLLLRMSVTHLSRMLLLWSFKAKREYNGVQRQHDLTSTQGQTPVFIFMTTSSFFLP